MERNIERKIEILKSYNKAARDIMAKREEIIANMYRAIHPTLKLTLSDEEILKQATDLADNALKLQLAEINRAAEEIERLYKETPDKNIDDLQPNQPEINTLEDPEEPQVYRQL